MRGFVVLSVSLILLGTLFSIGCGDDHHSNPNNFGVQTATPANGATCVDPAAAIQITFNGNADSNTINTNTIQVTDPSNNVIAGTVTYDAGSRTATFTPTSALTSNLVYKITVSGVMGSNGSGMTTSFTESFTTGPCSNGQLQYNVSLVDATNLDQTFGTVSVDSSGVVTTALAG